MFRLWRDNWHTPTFVNGSWGLEWDFGKFSFFIKHRKKTIQ